MKKTFAAIGCLILLCATSEAIDLGGLESIGPVSSFTRTDTAVTFNCQDNSQVRISILAPDLAHLQRRRPHIAVLEAARPTDQQAA